MFYYFWREHFNHLKVSKSSKDICKECYVFFNRKNSFLLHQISQEIVTLKVRKVATKVTKVITKKTKQKLIKKTQKPMKEHLKKKKKKKKKQLVAKVQTQQQTRKMKI